MGIGGPILNFIGAVVRWIYGTLWRTIAQKPKFKFREYLYGPENSDDWYDLTGHCFVNKIVAWGAIALILLLRFWH